MYALYWDDQNGSQNGGSKAFVELLGFFKMKRVQLLLIQNPSTFLSEKLQQRREKEAKR